MKKVNKCNRILGKILRQQIPNIPSFVGEFSREFLPKWESQAVVCKGRFHPHQDSELESWVVTSGMEESSPQKTY